MPDPSDPVAEAGRAHGASEAAVGGPAVDEGGQAAGPGTQLESPAPEDWPPVASLGELIEQVEPWLAQDTHAAARRALRRVLAAAEQGLGPDPALDELAERAAALVMDWDQLALDHHSTVLAAADLDLLRRWNETDPRVLGLEAGLQHLEALQLALREAQAFQRAGKLVGSGQDNAAARLRRVLELEPAHPHANQALARIETDLLGAAHEAAATDDYARAERLLADAGRVRRGSPGVQDMAARVIEMREARAREWAEQVAAALDAADLALARSALERLEAIALDEQMIGHARAEIERVRRYGRHDAGAVFVDPVDGGVPGPAMVVLPVGEFQMGSPEDEAGRAANEGPQRRIRFPRGFALSRTEITVAQFRLFVESSGYRPTAQRRKRSMVYEERSGALVERRRVSWSHDYVGQTAADEQPVLHVSWPDADAYARWLAERTGAGYRLPSEAEFEYALRAGTQTPWPWPGRLPPQGAENLTGALDVSPSGRRWSNAFAGYGDGWWGVAPVGSFAANAFGLHDINGNVSEWVADCWHESYARAPRDASAWINPGCERHVVRGASWASSPDQARSAFRLGVVAETTNPRVGFRVARDL